MEETTIRSGTKEDIPQVLALVRELLVVQKKRSKTLLHCLMSRNKDGMTTNERSEWNVAANRTIDLATPM